MYTHLYITVGFNVLFFKNYPHTKEYAVGYDHVLYTDEMPGWIEYELEERERLKPIFKRYVRKNSQKLT